MTSLMDTTIYQITSPSKYFFDNEDNLMDAFFKIEPLLFLETKNISIYHYKSKGENFSFVEYINDFDSNSTKFIIKGFIKKIDNINKNNIVFSTTSNVLLNILKMEEDGKKIPSNVIGLLFTKKISIFKNIDFSNESYFFPHSTFDQVLFEKAMLPFENLSLISLYREERDFLIKNITIEMKTFFNNFVKSYQSGEETEISDHFCFLNPTAITYYCDDYFYLINKEGTNLELFEFNYKEYKEEQLYDENDNFIFLVENFKNNYIETLKKLVNLNPPSLNIDIGILTNFNNHSFNIDNNVDLNSFMQKISIYNSYLMKNENKFLSGWNLSFDLFEKYEKGNNSLKDFLSCSFFRWNSGLLYTPVLIKPCFYEIKTFSKFNYKIDSELSLWNEKTDETFFKCLFFSDFSDKLLTYTKKEYDEFKPIIDKSVMEINKNSEFVLSYITNTINKEASNIIKEKISLINSHYSTLLTLC